MRTIGRQQDRADGAHHARLVNGMTASRLRHLAALGCPRDPRPAGDPVRFQARAGSLLTARRVRWACGSSLARIASYVRSRSAARFSRRRSAYCTADPPEVGRTRRVGGSSHRLRQPTREPPFMSCSAPSGSGHRRPSSCHRPTAPRPGEWLDRGRTPVSAEKRRVSSESCEVPEACPWMRPPGPQPDQSGSVRRRSAL